MLISVRTSAFASLLAVLCVFLIASPALAAEGDELGSLLDSVRQNVDNKRVAVEGTVKSPGDSPTTPRNPSHRSGNTNPVANVHAPARDTRTHDEKFTDCNTLWDLMRRCIPTVDKPADAPQPEDPRATTPITITDLATFAPAPATITGEPDNLGVAGLPTNFTTTATTHTRTGELFGYRITVRFTPASITYHYGDKHTQNTHDPGTTWETLHQAQFTPTPTSHTYTERGQYTATADTTYTAEIDLGTGYFPLAGTLTIPGTPQTIHIYEAHTALVAHTCNEDPHAPGC